MKDDRQSALLRLIREYHIETQDELSDRLTAMGFVVTQATVSRDIKELGLFKTAGEGGRYRYAAPVEQAVSPEREKLIAIFRGAVNSIAVAQHTLVLKTAPGMANSACLMLDSMPELNIIGTLAGDDTALIVAHDAPAAAALRDKLDRILAR
ncbi:arginine repressor [Clostridia bacterium]|nr:arginine repressor [Clostridia bacterium]